MRTRRWSRGAAAAVVAAVAAGSLSGCGDDRDGRSPSRAGVAEAGTPPPEPTASASVGAAGRAPTPTASMPPGAVRRWYDVLQEGKKVGTYDVTWAPSTWSGHATIRDVTTQYEATTRDMAGTADVFTTETLNTTERGEDGTLWWTRAVTTEANGRRTVAETTWTGNGYDSVVELEGTRETYHVDTKEPTSLDVESAIGPRLARGELAPGAKVTLRYAAPRRKRVVETEVEVLGKEDGPGEQGPVSCWKLRETDAETRSTTTYWIDGTGAVARLKALSTEVRRVSKSKADERPEEPPSFTITAPANPAIERIFTADRTFVDVRLRGDPDRPIPEFPTSPFSRVLSVEGDDAQGWTVHMRLDAYDVPSGVSATIPVEDPAFADDLAPTILMPCGHPDVVAKARAIVGPETDALRAVRRIADFVFTLEKQSPEIADTTAVEILKEGRGDCSEHAVLFVALCRAAGIPARRCSGFVSVGELWGAHAFAEVWVGGWMGVDPTTDDVGTAARYVFFGYSDAPDSHAGVVSARAAGRMRFEVTSLEEAGATYDLRSSSSWRVVDEKAKTASHRLAGIEVRDWPDDWTVRLRGSGEATIAGPGFTAKVQAVADQGYRGPRYLQRMGPRARATTFAGAPAIRSDLGDDRRLVVVSSRRRRVSLLVKSDSDADLDATLGRLERALSKTFEPSPHGW